MFTKKAKTQYPINEILANRWSTRSFDSTKKVEREKILSICEAARWSPSCFNEQPWRFMIFDKNQNEEAYNKAFACLGEWNQKWVEPSPVLIAVFANDKFEKNGKDNRWAHSDTGHASMSIMLESVNQGLMSHPMGGYDAEKLKAEFNIPDGNDSISMLAVGYQAEPDNMNPDYKDGELQERVRKDLSENFFESTWGNGID